jgi:hypothetical protein
MDECGRLNTFLLGNFDSIRRRCNPYTENLVLKGASSCIVGDIKGGLHMQCFPIAV